MGKKRKKKNGNTAQKQHPLPTHPKDNGGVTHTKETKGLSVKIFDLTAENTSEDIKKHKDLGSIILKVLCKEN